MPAIASPTIAGNDAVPLAGTAAVGQSGDPASIGGVALGSTVFSMLFWAFGFPRTDAAGLSAQAASPACATPRGNRLPSAPLNTARGPSLGFRFVNLFLSICRMSFGFPVRQFQMREGKVRTTIRPAKIFTAIWQNVWAPRQDEQERRRIEHADKVKHALIVLEAMRSWNLESGKSQA